MNGQSLAAWLARHRNVCGAVSAGLLVRVLLAIVVDYSETTADDAATYRLLADNLAHHGAFSLASEPPFPPTTLRAPLLPLFAALSFRIFGPALWPVHVAQALLGVAVALLVAGAFARVVPAIARPVLWATVLSPSDALYAGRLLTETLATALVCTGVALPILVRRRWGFVAAGVALGLATLTRDVFLVFIPVMAASTLLLRRGERGGGPTGALAPALLLLGAALAIAPWTYRNCTQTPTCTLVSKGLMGHNLWIGTWEREPSWLVPVPRYPDDAFDSAAERADLEPRDNHDPANEPVFLARALARIRARPLETFETWLVRAPRMWIGTRSDLFVWRLRTRSLPWYALKSFFFGLNALVVAFGAWGLVTSSRRRGPLLWMAVPIVLIAAVYFPFHDTETRYSQPVYPILIGFAVLAAAHAGKRCASLARRFGWRRT
jgi:4-amino-4-deoxy-L-arabinose transferase-like glycosyltransferase